MVDGRTPIDSYSALLGLSKETSSSDLASSISSLRISISFVHLPYRDATIARIRKNARADTVGNSGFCSMHTYSLEKVLQNSIHGQNL